MKLWKQFSFFAFKCGLNDASCFQENDASLVIYSIQEQFRMSVTNALVFILLTSPEMRYFEDCYLCEMLNILKSSSKQLKYLLIISMVF
jgi:hypothetical protein